VMRTGITPEQAQERLERLQGLMDVLDRTGPEDGSATGEVPSRAERERLIAPGRARLAELARGARRVRRTRKKVGLTSRPVSPTAKEKPPMAHYCIVAGHPNHPGAGCVLDDPNAKPPAPPPAPVVPGIPPPLLAEVVACEGVFFVPNPVPVRRQRAVDLARRVIHDYPERDRVDLIASLFSRFLQRGRGGRDGGGA
jgi:hypothetical protein